MNINSVWLFTELFTTGGKMVLLVGVTSSITGVSHCVINQWFFSINMTYLVALKLLTNSIWLAQETKNRILYVMT